MNKIRPVLVIGANGLVGQKILQFSSAQIPVIGTSFSRFHNDFVPLDVTIQEGIDSAFDKIKPSCIVHCANFPGGAKRCESEKKAAKQFHFESTKYLVEACKRHQSKLVFISTECVFDGKKEVYAETDAISPANYYGLLKASSEEWIKNNMEDFLIIRTMFVFGWQPETKTPNALMSTYFSLKKREPAMTPTYRWGQPTYVGDLAQAMMELIGKNRRGIYHIAGKTYMNRYDWMKKCCRRFGWDENLIMPQDMPNSDDIPFPNKIRFETSKFLSENQSPLHELDEALTAIQQDMKDHPDV